jgi:hypothetical protein
MEILKQIMASEIRQPLLDKTKTSSVILEVLSLFNNDTLDSLSTEVESLENSEIYRDIIQKIKDIQLVENDVTKILSVDNINIKEVIINSLTEREFMDKVNSLIINNNIFQNYLTDRLELVQSLNNTIEVNNITNLENVLNNINNLSNKDILNITEFINLNKSLNTEEFNTILNQVINNFGGVKNVNDLQNEFNNIITLETQNMINGDELNTIINENVLNNNEILSGIINNQNVLQTITNNNQNVLNVLTENMNNVNNIENVNRLDVNNINQFSNVNELISKLVNTSQVINNIDGGVNNVITNNTMDFGVDVLNKLSTEVVNQESNVENIINNNIENVYNSISEVKNEFMSILETKFLETKKDNLNVSTLGGVSSGMKMDIPKVIPTEKTVEVYPKPKDIRPLPKFSKIGEWD